MCEYVDDREYIQPEQETIDFLVYAEYVAYQLRGISQDIQDAQSGQSRQGA
jgi:hypothetical protein